MTLRILPYTIGDGPHNMAADEAVLLAASAGQASLHFYGWSETTLSLGYFQPFRTRPLASLPWIRRPTGGATLVHHHELTYALALPSDLAKSAPSWMARMHGIVADSLGAVGRDGDPVRMWTGSPSHPTTDDPLCFKQLTMSDLVCGAHKVMGSSQRKQRQCLLQHGALLLAQSPFTPTLPGLKELTGTEPATQALMDAIIQAFQKTTGWQVQKENWTAEEEELIECLAVEKYGRPQWNEKR